MTDFRCTKEQTEGFKQNLWALLEVILIIYIFEIYKFFTLKNGEKIGV